MTRTTWNLGNLANPATLALVLASTAGAQAKGTTLADEMASRKMDPALVKKAEAGKALSIQEMGVTLKAGVPEPTLLSYIKKTRAVYEVTPKGVSYLKASGASNTLVNYLLEPQTVHTGNMQNTNLYNPPTYDPTGAALSPAIRNNR